MPTSIRNSGCPECRHHDSNVRVCVIVEVYGMTKANLIDQISESTERTKKETEQTIDAVLAAIADALGKGEKVDLRGFGSFQVSGKKSARGGIRKRESR